VLHFLDRWVTVTEYGGTNNNFMSTRSMISKLLLFSLVLAISLTVSWAGTTEGSTATARSFTDSALAQVMIFNGDFFTNGNTFNASTFMFFNGNGIAGRFVTPILFEETANGVYTVRGFGASDTTTTGLNSFAYASVSGGTSATSGNWTFGFIEASENANGTQATASTGGVDLNTPPDGGTGVSGVGTNDWLFTQTPGAGTIVLTVNTTTFCDPSRATGCTYMLNTSTLGGFDRDRTYSAKLDSSASGVPEPGTLTLFTSGAGLLLAGLLRFRRRRE
jgi:hypothetical protein